MSLKPTTQASRSSPTSETSAPTATASISSAEASPARISASPDDDEVSQGTAPDCSSNSLGSSSLFDPDGSCSRTSPASYRRTTGETWEPLSVRWPTSGMASGGEFSTHGTSECPSVAVECSLSDVLETTVDPRFDVSARAARGVLRRSTVRGRKLPEELQRGLEATASRSPSPVSTPERTPLETERRTTSSSRPSRPEEATEVIESMQREQPEGT